MKNLWKLFAASVLLSAASVFGGCDNNTCEPTECNSCSSCCCTPCCCEPCDFVPPCPPDVCAYNAPDYIDIKCGCDFYVTASFVYFQAKEENLEFMENRLISVENNFQDTRTSVEYSTLCFDYEPAFKVGLGYNFGCDNWDFFAEYFRYHANVGKNSLNGSVDPTSTTESMLTCLYLLLGNNATFVDSSQGEAKWRLEIDTADFLLGRKYYVGKCLTFHPFLGLRAAWIDQTYNVSYHTSDGVGIDLATEDATVCLDSSSWAIGAKTGINTEWKFCGCFYLFGDTSFDILYTDYEIQEQKEITSFSGGTAPITSISPINGNKNDKFCFLRPHLQIGLGLGWGSYFCCNDWYFDLNAGYEFHVYWNQNVLPMIPDFRQDPSRLYGDLYLHGLVITVKLDF